MLTNILLSVALVILLVALALLFLIVNEHLEQRHRLVTSYHQDLGLPPGELVYEDAHGQGEALSSDQYPLMGKPDYIVKQNDGCLVPIELKLSVQNVDKPYSNHVVQIAAYCLILEDYSEVLPTHGILRYSDRDFTIEYTPALRRKVIRLLNEMQQWNEQVPPPITRQKAAKCRACAFQPVCPVGQEK